MLALITKISMMFQEKCKESDQCPDYNKDVLDPTFTVFKYSLGVLMGIGLIFDILAKKFRYLAHAFIYLESLFGLVTHFVPIKSFLKTNSFEVVIAQLVNLFVFYCDSNIQLIFSMACLSVGVLVLRPLLYN